MSDYINPRILLGKLPNGKNDPVAMDKLFIENPDISLKTDLDGLDGYGYTILHKIVGTRNYLILYYLLTSPNIDVNTCTKEVYSFRSDGGNTPLHYSISRLNKDNTKTLLAFGADKNFNGGYKVKTPFELTRHYDYQDRIIANILKDYNPSENVKITQKVVKLSVDCYFAYYGVKRSDHELVDAKFGGFESIWEEVFPGILDAVRNGNLELLFISMRECYNVKKYWFNERESCMLIYLALEAISNQNPNLLGYLLRQIFKSSGAYRNCDFEDFIIDNEYEEAVFVVDNTCEEDNKTDKTDYLMNIKHNNYSENISTIFDILMNLNNTLALELVKKLILIGLDPSCVFNLYVEWIDDRKFRGSYDKTIVKEVAEEFDTSSILCVVKLLFHKQIYLDEDNNCILIQTLIGEGLLFGL